MTDSIYNNAAMPSGQGAAPQIPEDLRKDHAQILRMRAKGVTLPWFGNDKQIELIERIAALTLERDTLKAERDALKEQVADHENGDAMNEEEFQDICGCLEVRPSPCCASHPKYCHLAPFHEIKMLRKDNATLRAEIEQWKTWCIVEIAVRNPSVAEYMDHWEGRATKAEAKVERLSAPVSEQEFKKFACDVSVENAKGHLELEQMMWRGDVMALIAARASTPPAHPINDDEQRRKDAGWNDRPKARCACGEMIAWYSGEYLHVAGRSKSCADGRRASPAHFLVGMPPA